MTETTDGDAVGSSTTKIAHTSPYTSSDVSPHTSLSTPLAEILRTKIAADGPLRVDEYMQLCLQHPEHGYYIKNKAVGTAGDFITAPEVSQIFGEMCALWAVQQWQSMGSPSRFSLVELGPGRGTLMADLLRTAAQISPNFVRAKNLMLLDSNKTLRAQQAEKLQAHKPRWMSDVLDLGKEDMPGPLLVLGNEFIDALPVRQFVRRPEGWCETLVGLKGQEFGFLHSAPAPEYEELLGLPHAAEDTIREISPARAAVVQQLAEALNAKKGAVLLIDYGYEQFSGHSSLLAYHKHRPVEFTHLPGETDLTALVDFSVCTNILAAAGLKTKTIQTQAQWLRAQGAEWRAAQLCTAGPAQGFQISLGLSRLLLPSQMGSVFKVLQATTETTS